MTTRFTSRRTNKPRVNNQRVQVPPSRKAENLKKSPKVPHQKDQRIKEPPLKREEEFKKCQKLQAVKGKRITDAHSKGTKDINGSPELMAVKNHIIKEPPLEREEGLEGSMIPKVRNNHLTQGTIKGKGVAESEAVVKRTMDAEGDFRESMVEMISQNEIGNPEELEELLASYLYLNPDEYQDVIIRAFRQVWLQVLEISRNN
ncbi:transcription repressor OFP3-like [Amborella trichopoda]|uniref:transcription repressor OFP3-like n=1 Tax=Amborella trichopoda TaxID=13333 RepID=UPI0009BE722F|nr:transcription repressor OFP3-like [Amborella trichopoda]|eukprot:XP_011620474.2 transcription repressor OFP3-like [Amborella trichopoda]